MEIEGHLEEPSCHAVFNKHSIIIFIFLNNDFFPKHCHSSLDPVGLKEKTQTHNLSFNKYMAANRTITCKTITVRNLRK